MLAAHDRQPSVVGKGLLLRDFFLEIFSSSVFSSSKFKFMYELSFFLPKWKFH